MNELDWKYYRTQENMPLEIFYDYFMEHKPDSKITLDQFKRKFPEYLGRPPMPNTRGQLVKGHLPTIIHKIHNYYDDKYGYERNHTEEG